MSTEREQQFKENLEKARSYLEQHIDIDKDNAVLEAASAFKRVAAGPKYKAPIEALKLAAKLRKDVKNHKESPWLVAFTMAICCDSLDAIPIAGWIISWFFRPFLFFFLWGKGTWKVRLIYYLLLLIDFAPVVNMIPLSTACVLYAYLKSREKHDEALKKISEVSNTQQKRIHFPARLNYANR